jgi:hypothetical protein
MQIGLDQTDETEVANVAPDFKGSGVFAVPNPFEPQFMAYTKAVVPGLTYQDCRQRGAFCIAFKWVAKNANITSCPLPLYGKLCVGSCGSDLCLCINGICG